MQTVETPLASAFRAYMNLALVHSFFLSYFFLFFYSFHVKMLMLLSIVIQGLFSLSSKLSDP